MFICNNNYNMYTLSFKYNAKGTGSLLRTIKNSLDPILGVLQDLHQFALLGLGLGLVHVLPAGVQGQGHQDALVPGSRRV